MKITVFFLMLVCAACSRKNNHVDGDMRTVHDALDREVVVPQKVSRFICSGSGILRYATYLESQDEVVAVDGAETRRAIHTIPYSLAHREYAHLPVFGEFRGRDNPELILALDSLPQIIFKSTNEGAQAIRTLQQRTGIPVVAIEYGDIINNRKAMYSSFTLMGTILNKKERARQVIDFFEEHRTALAEISFDTSYASYIGGLSSGGTYGFVSTTPNYTPFQLIGVNSILRSEGKMPLDNVDHTLVSKEKIVSWDPDVVFVDLASTRNPDGPGNVVYELETDPLYQNLAAKEHHRIYGVLPFNAYNTNHGSVLANAYYIAHVLGAAGYETIDPQKQADDIYEFLVGQRVFDEINDFFDGMVFRPLF
ncbi:MAG: ABC transporter substrate-binding protein [Fibrobacterota bacterium]